MLQQVMGFKVQLLQHFFYDLNTDMADNLAYHKSILRQNSDLHMTNEKSFLVQIFQQKYDRKQARFWDLLSHTNTYSSSEERIQGA